MVRRDADVRSGPALLAKRFSEVRSEANASAQRGGYSFAFIRVIRGYKSDQVRFGQQPKPTPKGFGVLPRNENGPALPPALKLRRAKEVPPTFG